MESNIVQCEYFVDRVDIDIADIERLSQEQLEMIGGGECVVNSI
jgi:hypothetical protein